MKLEEWEEICPDCKGNGSDDPCIGCDKIDCTKCKYISTLISLCDRCNGTGKIDWLEKVMDKKRKFIIVWDSVPAGFNRGQLNVITSKGIEKIRNKK